jgi:16S rRNA (guanine527-N7)-methyltransferase
VSRAEVWPAAEIAAGARPVLGRALTPAESDALEAYGRLLRRWNLTHRLVGPRSLGDIGLRLVLDSLLFRAPLPPEPFRCVDIGAGAGIPGIPLVLVCPGMELVLVESRRKPVSFLLTAIRELGLPRARVVHARAEEALELDPELAGGFDAAVARCVEAPERLASLAARYCRPGGVLALGGWREGRPVRPDLGVDWTGVRMVQVATGAPGKTRAILVARRRLEGC